MQWTVVFSNVPTETSTCLWKYQRKTFGLINRKNVPHIKDKCFLCMLRHSFWFIWFNKIKYLERLPRQVFFTHKFKTDEPYTGIFWSQTHTHTCLRMHTQTRTQLNVTQRALEVLSMKCAQSKPHCIRAQSSHSKQVGALCFPGGTSIVPRDKGSGQ